MCGARCVHFSSVITTKMDHKVQLLKPLNLGELYTALQNLPTWDCMLDGSMNSNATVTPNKT
jgi:hypothetical protein